MAKLRISNGVYFLHLSFLKEISENWITKGQICEGAKLLIALSVCNYDVSLKRISCDRTLEEINKSKNKIGFVPGFLDLIEEQSLPDEEELGDDEYSLKVASLKGITTKHTFFIVENSICEKMKAFVNSKGYKSIKVCCVDDFELE